MFSIPEGSPVSHADSLLLSTYLHADFDNLLWSTVGNTKTARQIPHTNKISNAAPLDGIPITASLAKSTTTYLEGFLSKSEDSYQRGMFSVVYRSSSPKLIFFNRKLKFNSTKSSLVPVVGNVPFNYVVVDLDRTTKKYTSAVSIGSLSSLSFLELFESNFDIPSFDLSSIEFSKTDESHLTKYQYPEVTIPPIPNFLEHWGLREGLEFPRVLVRGLHAIEGLPGESIRNYVFVEIAPDGTMFYQGEIYKTLGMNNLISKFVGEPGESVKHTWGGERQRARDGKTYVYLASGVQDPDYPGGYGSYLPDTERTVTLRADRSINVNFYYIAADLPEYNYLMRISVPNGGFHIAILKENVSAIKLKMPDESICTVDIVTLEDEMASDIRVSLPTGIFALKKVVLSD